MDSKGIKLFKDSDEVFPMRQDILYTKLKKDLEDVMSVMVKDMIKAELRKQSKETDDPDTKPTKIAVYKSVFDPVTRNQVSLIKELSTKYDKVVLIPKIRIFAESILTATQRNKLLECVTKSFPNVIIDPDLNKTEIGKAITILGHSYVASNTEFHCVITDDEFRSYIKDKAKLFTAKGVYKTRIDSLLDIAKIDVVKVEGVLHPATEIEHTILDTTFSKKEEEEGKAYFKELVINQYIESIMT